MADQKRLTDRQRKKIIAEYVQGGTSYSKLANKYGVCKNTIAKLLKDKEVVRLCTEKKKENTQSMLEYLDSQRGLAQDLIGQLLSSVSKDIAKASLKSKIGAIKVLSEVFVGSGVNTAVDNTITEIIVNAEDASGTLDERLAEGEADDETAD